jgi:hypothetical protein
MLATGSVVTAATTFRVGASCVGLAADRTPALVRLAVHGFAGRGDTGKAQAAFRDELIALLRDSADASWRAMRRGVDDLDAFTRPHEGDAPSSYRRPYRVKS